MQRTEATGRSSTESYEVGARLGWELDIWGKLRQGKAAAEAEVQASGADWRAAYLALVAEVAGQYLRLRQIDELLGLYARSIASSERVRAIYQNRAEERMVSSEVPLRQRAETERLRREEEDLQRERRTVENGLAALLGLPAGDLAVGAEPLTGLAVPEVPAGLPASLLERRPDILAAEYRVLAAYELAGQARLDRLPSISLTGSGGTASATLGSLLSEWLVGLGPTITIPVFDPARKAQGKVREAEVRIASDQYRSTVVRAFQETENALVNRASRLQQREIARGAVADLRRVQQTSEDKFREGLVSQLEMLETERGLIQAEQTALEQHYRLLNDTVTLYKALGGGW
jgi:NodT family efflux transporter outer membrane factor (OMF) lipoprotein